MHSWQHRYRTQCSSIYVVDTVVYSGLRLSARSQDESGLRIGEHFGVSCALILTLNSVYWIQIHLWSSYDARLMYARRTVLTGCYLGCSFNVGLSVIKTRPTPHHGCHGGARGGGGGVHGSLIPICCELPDHDTTLQHTTLKLIFSFCPGQFLSVAFCWRPQWLQWNNERFQAITISHLCPWFIIEITVSGQCRTASM